MSPRVISAQLGAWSCVLFASIVLCLAACSERGVDVGLEDRGEAPPVLSDASGLSEEERSVLEASFARGFGGAGGDDCSTEILFVDGFSEISGLGAPWVEAFVLSGAADSVARTRALELDLEFGARNQNHAILLVTAWQVVTEEAVGKREAKAVLRQLEGAGERSNTQTETLHALTAAVLLEASYRAQASRNDRQALSRTVREDFKRTTGVDFASLQIGPQGFSRKAVAPQSTDQN